MVVNNCSIIIIQRTECLFEKSEILKLIQLFFNNHIDSILNSVLKI